MDALLELVLAEPIPFVAGVGVAIGAVIYLAIQRSKANRLTVAEPAADLEEKQSDPPEDGEHSERPTQGLFWSALARTRAAFVGGFDQLFSRGVVDDALLQELEDVLLMADVGMPTTTALIEQVKDAVKEQGQEIDLREVLKSSVATMLNVGSSKLTDKPGDGPLVMMFVGVNGSGKTTTIGKVAARLKAQGESVILAAADTFRAAAADQLKVWAERAGAEIVTHPENADPGAVVYDTLSAAKARGHTVVLIDTAGRLQTKKPLMAQLSKLDRVCNKLVEGAPHETLLVVDGTAGQNAMSQAKNFNEATSLTGVIVTKLDGTAKGGVVLAIANEMGLPVKFVGLGEGVDDLIPFNTTDFVEALF